MKMKLTLSLQAATRYNKEIPVYVGFCPALKIFSQGETEKQAMSALESTVALYLVTCYRLNILHKVLNKAGFQAVESPFGTSPGDTDKEFIAIHNFDKIFDINVPWELVAAASSEEGYASSSPRTA